MGAFTRYCITRIDMRKQSDKEVQAFFMRQNNCEYIFWSTEGSVHRAACKHNENKDGVCKFKSCPKVKDKHNQTKS